MKTTKSIIIAVLISGMLVPELSAQKAQKEFTPAVGIGLKASLNGLGVDAVYSFYNKMDVRLGFETMGFNYDFSFEEQSVNYDAVADIKMGNISLLYDYHLTDNFFVAAGFGYNMFNTQVDGEAASSLQFGDVEIPKESIGTFSFGIDPSLKISPYLGIGFGKTLGQEKRLACAFEVGGYYQGSPNITIVSDGLLEPTSNPNHQQAERLEGQISQYTIYPVLKFSLSYKIVDL